jgi:High potential iron-sulfur protein
MAQTPRMQWLTLSRRTVILQGLAAASVLVASIKEAAAKLAQAAASYQYEPKDDRRCDSCSLFQSPSSCQLVDGTISASGWCKFWVKKSS